MQLTGKGRTDCRASDGILSKPLVSIPDMFLAAWEKEMRANAERNASLKYHSGCRGAERGGMVGLETRQSN